MFNHTQIKPCFVKQIRIKKIIIYKRYLKDFWGCEEIEEKVKHISKV